MDVIINIVNQFDNIDQQCGSDYVIGSNVVIQDYCDSECGYVKFCFIGKDMIKQVYQFCLLFGVGVKMGFQ